MLTHLQKTSTPKKLLKKYWSQLNMNMHSALVCPFDKGRLSLSENKIHCSTCNKVFDIVNDIPVFFSDSRWEKLYKDDPHYKSGTPFSLENDIDYIHHFFSPEYLKDKLILDVGCGDGVYSSNINQNSNVFCTDVTLTGLQRLQTRKMKHVTPILSSGLELPFADNSVDIVLFIFVVEHLPRKIDLNMLREIKRVLKPNGKLIYVTDTPFYDRHLLKLASAIFRGKIVDQDHTTDTGHINLLSMQRSRALLHEAGFFIKDDLPYFMGSRFKLWRFILKLAKAFLPKQVCEDYLTSKYAFLAEK